MATGLQLIISSICNATFCEPIYDNPLSGAGLTRYQLELQRLTQDLNGKHLKVATYNNFPLSYVEKQQNGTLVGRGVAFTVFEILRQRFNFTFEVVLAKRNFEIGGSSPEDSLIGLVNNSLVDMAVAFVPTLVKFRRRVTFSAHLDEGVWAMMLKRPKESATGAGLLAPFDSTVWYLILVAVISYVPCITVVTKMRDKLYHDDEKPISLYTSFWFVYAGFIKQGSTLNPDSNPTRMVFATWWIFIILLSSFYTANLTAFLTLSKFTLDIKSAEDLYKRNYRWVTSEGGAIEYMVNDPEEDLHYLSKMVSNGRAEFRSFARDDEYLPLMMGGVVLVKELTAVDHIMYADYLSKAREGIDEAERCTFVISPDAFIKIPRAFAYPMNSNLSKLFDPVFTYILQSGIINFLEVKDLPTTKMCPLDLQSKDRKLRNSDLTLTYFLMLAGLAASVSSFIGEILLTRYIKVKIRVNGEPKRKKHKRIKSKDKEDSHPPPPYDSLYGFKDRYKDIENSVKKIINGREYYVVKNENGDTKLIPARSPSAFLYQ